MIDAKILSDGHIYDNVASSGSLNEASIKEFIDGLVHFHAKEKKGAGALVLCCEAFTVGHRYLVEYAAERVPLLYCFVADDFESAMPFEDRFRLVREGVADIQNVTVVPGGMFVASSKFYASRYSSLGTDADLDAYIGVADKEMKVFAERVAPALGINIRFSGGDPVGGATRAYNMALQEVLAQYDIAFQMIPKTASCDAVIIDEMIDKYIKEQQFDAISALAPPATVQYIKEKFEIPKIGYRMKMTEEQLNISLSTISDFGGNIFNYFIQRGINGIYIYGGGNLARRLSIMASAIDNFRVIGYLGPKKSQIASGRPYFLALDVDDIDDVEDRGAPILVTCPIEPVVRHKLEYHFSEQYFLDVICTHEYYATCCVEPLLEITRDAGAELLLVNSAIIGKNPSEYERMLIEFSNSTPLKNRSKNDAIYENAYVPHGYDRDYLHACLTVLERDRMFIDETGAPCFDYPTGATTDSGALVAADCAGPYVNCKNGMRRTCDTQPEADCNIYFLGHTVAFGIGADDGGTIESHLQRMLNEKHTDDCPKYNVLNYANSSRGDVFEAPRLLRRLPLKQGDVVVCLLLFPWSVMQEFKQYTHICNVYPYFRRPHDFGEIFADTMHMNPEGYKQYAAAIYDALLKDGLIRKRFGGAADDDLEDSRGINAIEAKMNAAFANDYKKPTQYDVKKMAYDNITLPIIVGIPAIEAPGGDDGGDGGDDVDGGSGGGDVGGEGDDEVGVADAEDDGGGDGNQRYNVSGGAGNDGERSHKDSRDVGATHFISRRNKKRLPFSAMYDNRDKAKLLLAKVSFSSETPPLPF